MTAIFEKAPVDDHVYVESLMGKYHPKLTETGAKISLLFASDKTPGSSILTEHGHPIAGKIRVCSGRDRAYRLGDIEIQLDYENWLQLSPEEQAALVDQLLTRIVISKNKHGEMQFDDYGRPKLSMRSYDWLIGGFDEVIRRHGDAAIESQQLQKVNERYQQKTFEFAE